MHPLSSRKYHTVTSCKLPIKVSGRRVRVLPPPAHRNRYLSGAFLSLPPAPLAKICSVRAMRFRVSSSFASPRADLAGVRGESARSISLSRPCARAHTPPEIEGDPGAALGKEGGEEVRERPTGVHPGEVGRDNHRTDTDMLIPESFTRDI